MRTRFRGDLGKRHRFGHFPAGTVQGAKNFFSVDVFRPGMMFVFDPFIFAGLIVDAV